MGERPSRSPIRLRQPWGFRVDSDLITALEVVVGVPAVLILYIWATERLITPMGGRWQARVRPWLWIAPALVLLAFFLVYPTIRTIIRSFQSRSELRPTFVGFDNYKWFFTNDDGVIALTNNVLWILFFTG